MYAYCVFCNTQSREDLAAGIRQLIDIEVIAPKIIQRKWVKGKTFEDIHDYLPGYLFLYTETPITNFSTLFRLEDVYRILGERDKGYYLSNANLAFANMLRACGGTIGVLKTYRKGDKVKLADGAMSGVDGEIVKLDRRGRALVRFGFDGSAIQSWVAIEMIEDDAAPKLIQGKPNDRTV